MISSSQPLFNKLGLKSGYNVKLLHAPTNYKELLGELSGTIAYKNKATENLDFIHLFTNSIKELEDTLPILKQQIKKEGMIWISWYKKGSGKASELTDNIVRDIALTTGLVDVKVCAIDEYWSGLKLVFRLKDR